MVTRRANTKKKKVPKVFSRRARTGIAAAPIDSYQVFNDYVRTEVDRKEISSTIKSYIKKNFTKEESEYALKAPEWVFAKPWVASIISWKLKGFPFPENGQYEKTLNRVILEIVESGKNKMESYEDEDSATVIIPKKSPAEIIKQRTSDFIGEVEEVIDMFGGEVWVDWDNYSVYNELKKIDAAYNTAKGVYDYYVPLRDEIKELVEEKTADLVEGYGWMTVPQRKQYFKIIQDILDDCDRYLLSKKAQRKIRKPKVRSSDKQVEKILYLKDSAEYKVTSIAPTSIVGARRVYLFNTKSRILTEIVSHLPNGFEVRGTTIQGIDEQLSRQILLRKPTDFLPIVQNKTVNQIKKEWDSLTTKSGKANGRVNKDTILLRAMDK
jgi:hypothetical protein